MIVRGKGLFFCLQIYTFQLFPIFFGLFLIKVVDIDKIKVAYDVFFANFATYILGSILEVAIK